MRDEVEAQRLGADLGGDLVAAEHVAQRLRHLGAVEVEEAVVHPVMREGVVAVGALRLCDLVLVVREHQILAAGVDVEGLAEVAGAHRGALDVPAGATGAPRRRPRRLAGLGALPQREVERAALAIVDGDAGASLEIIEGLLRQLAVAGEGRDLEVHVAVDRVGLAALDQARGDLDDLIDVRRHPRLDVGRQHAEHPHVGVVQIGVAVGVGQPVDARRRRRGEDLVLDVGDVADERHLVAEEHQRAADQIEADRRVGVADVRRRVGRGPAEVDPDAIGDDRRERDLLAVE